MLHLGATILFTFAHRLIFNVLIEFAAASAAHPFQWDDVFSSLSRYVDYGIMIYWILILFRQAIGYYRQVQQQALLKAELEAELNLAQLRALKMQLQPHFLFNTLNGISVLVRKNPDAACSMIARLADLLRMTLENTGSQEVPLEQELKTLGCYLEIEQMRFADRLKVSMAIDNETRGAFVPNLILQPLVENALLHGVAKQRGPATITIRSGRRNGTLTLEVEDTGPGVPERGTVREGIGISNTRSRLEQLYAGRYTFSVENAAPAGARATITLPFHTAALS
jgi:LytS/YehU family sensor histidine kinase